MAQRPKGGRPDPPRPAPRRYAGSRIRSSQASGSVCGSRSRRRRSQAPSGAQRALGARLDEPVHQVVQRLAPAHALVAQQHQVAAGVHRQHGRLGVAQRAAGQRARAGHAQVVAEKIAPVKPRRERRTSCSQGAEKPAGLSSTSGIDDVRRHHAGERGGQPLVRPRVVAQDLGERARIDRHVDMAVGRDVAVAGESACRSWPCRPGACPASGSWPAA
jgi:hypothetical protein